jgi:hypothetical protein
LFILLDIFDTHKVSETVSLSIIEGNRRKKSYSFGSLERNVFSERDVTVSIGFS